MSILINMEMPKSCQVCPLSHWNNDRPSWCPIVEIPKPHGRLGDLDRLLRDFQHDPLYPVLRKYNVEGWIAGHPTIIPAEKGEET